MKRSSIDHQTCAPFKLSRDRCAERFSAENAVSNDVLSINSYQFAELTYDAPRSVRFIMSMHALRRRVSKWVGHYAKRRSSRLASTYPVLNALRRTD
jgi:hypothetical protein